MGLNAYFSYQVVGANGSGNVPYQLALTAVFVEGFIFMFLALVGMRQWLVKLIPESVKVASGVGIGIFLTEIGLSGPGGIGLIIGGVDKIPLQIAGCALEYQNSDGTCASHKMTDPRVSTNIEKTWCVANTLQMWIGICLGGFVTAYLMMYKFKCAFVFGIALVSILSWP
jgi:AGZA family xanthine/uracil permease-like MFS transporter